MLRGRAVWKQATSAQELAQIMNGAHPARLLDKIPESGPVREAILKAIEEAVRTLLVPRPDNFTPPARTPWGGTRIREMMRDLGLAQGDIVGEAWAVSGHPSFPNKISFVSGSERIEAPLTFIGELFPSELFGPVSVSRHGSTAPFLTKLLNSSRNLSVQVHPTAAFAASRPHKGWHSKTEMWVVLGAKEGVGIYLGLKEGVTREEFTRAVADGSDVSRFLNFVPVKGGDVFFIPAGTPHAIGAGILLAEHQEASETTFRVYSWGDGRELHKEDGVAAINWDAPRGDALVESLRRPPSRISGSWDRSVVHENLAAEPEFSFDRIRFSSLRVADFVDDSSIGMQGVTVIKGNVTLYSSDGRVLGVFGKGQSFIIPAALGRYRLRGKDSEVLIGRSDPRGIAQGSSST